MEHNESEWRVAAHEDNQSGEPQGEIPFAEDRSGAWDDKMRALEEIHVEIGARLTAIQTALDDNTTEFESDWQEGKGGGYEEYQQAEVS
jgi:hypothetical protein